MVETHPLLLSLRSAGLKDLDPSNVDEVHNMWHAFSKAKNSIDGGDRLEYLSWRIYSREIMRKQEPVRFETLSPTEAPILDDADHDEVSDVSSVFSDISSDDEQADSVTNKASNALEPRTAMDDTNTASSRNTSVKGVENRSELNKVTDNGKSGSNSGYKIPATQTTSTDSPPTYTRPTLNRPISSIELEHLFGEVQHNDLPKRITSMPQPGVSTLEVSNDTGAKGSQDAPAKSTKSETRSAPLVNSKPREIVIPVRNPMVSVSTGFLKSGSVVRGFTSSSISVTKMHTSKQFSDVTPRNGSWGSSAKLERPLNSGSQNPAAYFDQDHISICRCTDKKSDHSQCSGTDVVEKSSGATTAAAVSGDKKQPCRMFFLGESENDSSSAGSPDDVIQARKEEEEAVDNNSDWDDTDAEIEEESEEEVSAVDAEARRKEMFREKPVPTKPLLKRSLLSTLFVNQVNTVQDQNEPLPENSAAVIKPTDQAAASEKRKVAAPVDILLDAPLAHHFPFVSNTRQGRATKAPLSQVNSTLRPELNRSSASMINNIGPFNTDAISPKLNDVRVVGQDNGYPAGMHMTARPEIYRASTDLGVNSLSKTDTEDRVDQQSWAHQHEDIYDPMNYHSRGW